MSFSPREKETFGEKKGDYSAHLATGGREKTERNLSSYEKRKETFLESFLLLSSFKKTQRELTI